MQAIAHAQCNIHASFPLTRNLGGFPPCSRACLPCRPPSRAPLGGFFFTSTTPGQPSLWQKPLFSAWRASSSSDMAPLYFNKALQVHGLVQLVALGLLSPLVYCNPPCGWRQLPQQPMAALSLLQPGPLTPVTSREPSPEWPPGGPLLSPLHMMAPESFVSLRSFSVAQPCITSPSVLFLQSNPLPLASTSCRSRPSLCNRPGGPASTGCSPFYSNCCASQWAPLTRRPPCTFSSAPCGHFFPSPALRCNWHHRLLMQRMAAFQHAINPPTDGASLYSCNPVF
ncbi:hypothetical protein GOP47_0018341, partial [Adiantum capillus-veneris]